MHLSQQGLGTFIRIFLHYGPFYSYLLAIKPQKLNSYQIPGLICCWHSGKALAAHGPATRHGQEGGCGPRPGGRSLRKLQRLAVHPKAFSLLQEPTITQAMHDSLEEEP